MRGWAARHLFEHTGLPWVLPSPNMPTVDTALVYPGHVPRRGHRAVRGPRHDAAVRAVRRAVARRPPARARHDRDGPAGLQAAAGRVHADVPQARDEGVRRRADPRHERRRVPAVSHRRRVPQGRATTRRRTTFQWRAKAYEFVDKIPAIDLLAGTAAIREGIEAGASLDDLAARWPRDEGAFLDEREPYLLYAMTVALFGGSFNPPHAAHQLVALYVLETQPIDELWFVPTYEHLFGKPLAPYEHRVAMCELAARAARPARAREPRRGGARAAAGLRREPDDRSHRDARRAAPRRALRLVIGSDILAETDKWHRWDAVVAAAPPIIIGRAGHPLRRQHAPASRCPTSRRPSVARAAGSADGERRRRLCRRRSCGISPPHAVLGR